MPYSMTYHPKSDFVNLVFTTIIARKDLTKATSECIDLQKRTGVLRFIVELDGWKDATLFVESYMLAHKYYSEEAANRLTRIAVVLPPTSQGRATENFYETARHNANWNTRVFDNHEDALDWLTYN